MPEKIVIASERDCPHFFQFYLNKKKKVFFDKILRNVPFIVLQNNPIHYENYHFQEKGGIHSRALRPQTDTNTFFRLDMMIFQRKLVFSPQTTEN